MTDPKSGGVTQLDLYTAIKDLEKTIGTRITELERWRILADGVQTGGLPVRMTQTETARDQLRGSIKTFRAFSLAISGAVGLFTIWAYLQTLGLR